MTLRPTFEAPLTTPEVRSRQARAWRLAATMVGFAGLGVYALFIVVVLVLRYGVLPNIGNYRTDIERIASQSLKAPVTVGEISADWQGLRPRLSLRDVRILDKSGAVALLLPHSEVVFSWDSVLTAELRLHRLEIDNANLDIRRAANGQLSVGGIVIQSQAGTSGAGFSDWLLDQRRIVIRDSSVTWTDDERHAPPITLNDTSVVLQRFGVRHRFALAATPPAAVAAPLDVRGYFDHDLFTDEGNSDLWSGEFFCQLDYIDLAAWNKLIDLPMNISSGTGALRSWLKFSSLAQRDGRLTRLPALVADVRLANVSTRFSTDLPQFEMAQLQGRISASSTPRRDVLRVDGLHVQTNDGAEASVSNLEGEREFNTKGEPSGGRVQADALSLATVATLGQQLPISPALRSWIVKVSPRGTLLRATCRWDGSSDAPAHYHFNADFHGLGLNGQPPPEGDDDPGDGSVGFTNLDGTATVSDTGGALVVDAHNATLDLPAWFSNAVIPVASLSIRAGWEVKNHELTVKVEHASVQNSEITATVSGTYAHGPQSGSRGPGTVNLTGRIAQLDLRQLARYMPVTLPADARSYLERAFLAGTAEDAAFSVRGPIEKFPFRDSKTTPAEAQGGAGVTDEAFRIDARIRNATLDYAPPDTPRAATSSPGASTETRWPIVINADGTLAMDRDRLTADISRAQIADTDVTKMSIRIDDVGQRSAAVKLAADIAGPAQNYVRFVNESPLGGSLGHLMDKTHVTGDARMHVDLGLPIVSPEKITVSGKLSFTNSDLALFEWLPQIAAVKGDLAFSESTLTIKGMSGKFLGGDLKLDATTASDHVLEVRGQGTLAAENLARVPELPFVEHLAQHMSGSAPYRVALNLAVFGANDAAAQTHGPRVLVESSLSGMAIDLPQPLTKAAAATLPLSITLGAARERVGGEHDQIDVHVGNVFNVAMARDADASGAMQVSHVGYGLNLPAYITDAHAFANIAASGLDADAWKRALDELSSRATPSNSTVAPSAVPSPANVFVPEVVAARIDDLKIVDKHFAKVTLGAAHANGVWQANLTSTEVQGHILWRDNAGVGDALQNRITARLERLIVPQSASSDAQELLDPNATPIQIPALDIIADDFQLHDHKLGRLELLAANVTTGTGHEWRMDKLNLTNPDATLQAKGTWGGASRTGADQTKMTLTLTASNVGGMFERLGMPGTVKGGAANVDGNVQWHGSPLSIDPASLSGTLKLDVKDGEFLKVDPGFGKLLGVLSLQSMQRRLSFDFSDLFANGFAFDAIDANATIENGVATSHDFEMRGPSAVVRLDGSADLAHETQNLHVRVLPQINLGVGSLAYALLANPAIGVGTLLFQELLKDPISRALAYEYTVTGPWTDPSITRNGVTTSIRPPANGAATAGPAPPETSPAITPTAPDDVQDATRPEAPAAPPSRSAPVSSAADMSIPA
jgi:uncharacterized protein (TIGR02099 family)